MSSSTIDSEIELLTIDRSDNSKKQTHYFAKVSFILTCLAVVAAYMIIDMPSAPVLSATEVSTVQNMPENASSITSAGANNITQQQIGGVATTSILDASGHIVARRIATISSRVTGKLEAVNIEEGVRVKKSQIIAELDSQQARISLQQAIARLQATQAESQELKLMQYFELQRLKRQTNLASKNLVSEQSIDDLRQKTQQLSVQIESKMARLSLAQKQVELAQYQLEQHSIKAPFDGVVISKNAQVGELISAGNSGGGFIRTGVGTIVDMSSLEIEVDVGESYINRVFAGQLVTATLDAYPNWQISSEVITIIPTADRQKASIKVRIKLLETDAQILPDMGVKVSFLGESAVNS